MNQWACSWCTSNLKKNVTLYATDKVLLSQAVDCPSFRASFQLSLGSEGKMPSRGPSSAKYCKLVDERAYFCLPTTTTHMFIASKIKGLPIFSWKIIIESFGLFDYHYFFVKMHVRGAWLSGVLARQSKKKQGYKTTLEKHILQARCVQYCNTAPFHFGQTAILSVCMQYYYVLQIYNTYLCISPDNFVLWADFYILECSRGSL